MQALLSVIRKIRAESATFGTSGNASARAGQAESFWITPSGVPWDAITATEMVELSVESGRQLTGHLAPSTEWRFHQGVYRAHDWAGGIVHLHSTYATVLSTINRAVQPVHYQMVRVADEVPVLPYATFGSAQLAKGIVEAISPQQRAVLLQNHGLVAVGKTVEQAHQAALEVEWTAMIQYHASLLAAPRVLTGDELQAVREAFSRYGQPSQEH